MVDLHRHDEMSSFDGFGKPEDLAKVCKELGHTAFSITNHGAVNSWVKHYKAAKANDLKPILGIETYFKPDLSYEGRGFHLCLYVKNMQGYKNINRLLYKAEKQKYYNGIITYDDLEVHHEGIICSSACVSGILSKSLLKKDNKQAFDHAKYFKQIFGDDFYIEIMPYTIDDNGTQEKLNRKLIKLADKLNIKCILTSDSHYGKKSDFDTYLKMHEIKNHDLKHIEETYGERYIPSKSDLVSRFCAMHEDDFKPLGNASKLANKMLLNIESIEHKIDGDILDQLEVSLPDVKIEKENELKQLIYNTKKGLKKRGKYNEKYWNRCKEEIKVISTLGYEKYFLIVQDFMQFAKKEKIVVGAGRGSACNCLTAYALGITNVDSIKHDLFFGRFMRLDKKKMPDIDIDFETERRQEVIDYIIKKYRGKAAQVCSYGKYNVDNLINDLAKVCGLVVTGDIDTELKNINKAVLKDMKKFINGYIDENKNLNIDEIKQDKKTKYYNSNYDNIIKHFIKMYGKVRYIGTHAAGVAVTNNSILDHCPVRLTKEGKPITTFDLTDSEELKLTKFDILGLKTMQGIGELRKYTGIDDFDDKWLDDKKIMKYFAQGKTDGIFQFESITAKDILTNIEADNFKDVIAATSMNRPAPLKLHMPEQYVENKFGDGEIDRDSIFYEYTQDTYGTLLYQEQVQSIAINVGGMEPWEADKITKLAGNMSEQKRKDFDEVYEDYKKKFIRGAKKHNINKNEAVEVFDRFFNYLFNKGHATGYSIISVEEMFYKVYYSRYFWLTKLKNELNERKFEDYKALAVNDDNLILLPHVNGTAEFSLSNYEGEECLQEGLIDIKNVGDKVAHMIETERKLNGDYKNYKDVIDRIPKRNLTIRVVNALENAGAMEFNQKIYLERVKKYNVALFGRAKR